MPAAPAPYPGGGRRVAFGDGGAVGAGDVPAASGAVGRGGRVSDAGLTPMVSRAIVPRDGAVLIEPAPDLSPRLAARLAFAVPEPAYLVLSGSGLVGLIGLAARCGT